MEYSIVVGDMSKSQVTFQDIYINRGIALSWIVWVFLGFHKNPVTLINSLFRKSGSMGSGELGNSGTWSKVYCWTCKVGKATCFFTGRTVLVGFSVPPNEKSPSWFPKLKPSTWRYLTVPSRTWHLEGSSQGSNQSLDRQKGWRTEAAPCSSLYEVRVLRRGKGRAQGTPSPWENCKVSHQKWFISSIQREEGTPPPRQIPGRFKGTTQSLDWGLQILTLKEDGIPG